MSIVSGGSGWDTCSGVPDKRGARSQAALAHALALVNKRTFLSSRQNLPVLAVWQIQRRTDGAKDWKGVCPWCPLASTSPMVLLLLNR